MQYLNFNVDYTTTCLTREDTDDLLMQIGKVEGMKASFDKACNLNKIHEDVCLILDTIYSNNAQVFELGNETCRNLGRLIAHSFLTNRDGNLGEIARQMLQVGDAKGVLKICNEFSDDLTNSARGCLKRELTINIKPENYGS
jgi:hypothetical protein